ncbi:MAG: hypothetical protein QXO75_07350 [Nitrososphaerota archaeon]
MLEKIIGGIFLKKILAPEETVYPVMNNKCNEIDEYLSVNLLVISHGCPVCMNCDLEFEFRNDRREIALLERQ